jgi:chemotaxis response regulator CheB
MNIIELSNESGLVYYGMGKDRARFIHHLEAFAALVAAQEREACAKLVDEIEARCIAKDVDDPPLDHVAAAIRERKTT